MIVFETQDDYYKWLNEPEQDIQDTVDTALEYIAQLHEQINILKHDNEQLKKYKHMYEDLCK